MRKNVCDYVNWHEIRCNFLGPIPVALRSKVWVCGRSLFGMGSNLAVGMNICLLWVLCVVT